MFESTKYYYNKKPTKHNFFYRLDCRSGEGLPNFLLIELKKTSSVEFEFYLEFILQECRNVNRSFANVVEFLSIWMEKSLGSLLNQLQDAKLNQFFNRTEYHHDGDQWCFPKLLQLFSSLIEKKQITANEILDYLFETLDFFSMPEIFVRQIIGYDRLEFCIKESPEVFKQALFLKIYEFIEQHKTIDIGSCSFKYLNAEIQAIDEIKRIKTELQKQTDRQELVWYIKNYLLICPSVKFNSSESSISPRLTCFRGNSSRY